MIKVTSYCPIDVKADYEILVTELFDTGEYRVGLCKDGMKLTECFDLMLTRSSDRRFLEQYVASKRQELPNLRSVWFGKPNWHGHYKLPDYIRQTYGNEYLNDINI